MNRTGKQAAILGLLLAFLLTPFLATAGISQAVDYLKSQTPDAWISSALLASGQTGLDLDHLKTVSGNTANDYAKTILALAAAEKDPRTFGNLDYLAKLRTYYQDGQIGDLALLNDDIWGMLALASVGLQNSPEFLGAKDYLLAHQNTDGGFSYGLNQPSDSNDTAAALMALVEAGLGSNDQPVVKALEYLKTTQNDDGGFGYDAVSSSDAGSDAWVICALKKLGQDLSTWQVAGRGPVAHLESLQDTDGGFWWVAPGTSDWNNKAMTPYAVIALAGKFFPVAYYTLADNQSNDQGDSGVVAGVTTPSGSFHLRLEGKNQTICDTYATGTTALQLLTNAASACGYTYVITQESFGPYLRQINDELAQGMSGWMYFVNDGSPMVGAGDYELNAGDEVLFYYGDWGWLPTKLLASQVQIEKGQTVVFSAKYHNGLEWLLLPNASLIINGQIATTTPGGQLSQTFEQNGRYEAYVVTEGYVRSAKVIIDVGSSISQNVGLQVEIESGGIVAGESIAISILPASIDFGKLKAGQSATKQVTLSNDGTVGITVTAETEGDSLFANNLLLNSQAVALFNQALGFEGRSGVDITLNVPAGYLSSGVKTGQLIFWAKAQ